MVVAWPGAPIFFYRFFLSSNPGSVFGTPRFRHNAGQSWWPFVVFQKIARDISASREWELIDVNSTNSGILRPRVSRRWCSIQTSTMWHVKQIHLINTRFGLVIFFIWPQVHPAFRCVGTAELPMFQGCSPASKVLKSLKSHEHPCLFQTDEDAVVHLG